MRVTGIGEEDVAGRVHRHALEDGDPAIGARPAVAGEVGQAVARDRRDGAGLDLSNAIIELVRDVHNPVRAHRDGGGVIQLVLVAMPSPL